MIDQFFEKLGSNLFATFGHLLITNIRFVNQDIVISLTLRLDVAEDDVEEWQIHCQQVKKYQLNSDDLTSLSFSRNHVLLWQYQQPYQQLNFEGEVSDINGLIVALLEKHQEIFRNWLSFKHFFYMNHRLTLKELLQNSSGILAAGPPKLIDEYVQIISRFGLTPMLSTSKDIERYNSFIAGFGQELSLINWSGNSYIIAKNFEFKQIINDQSF